MADMHAKMIEAVVHAADVVKHLSSKPEEVDVKKAAKTVTSAAASNTVDKPLPTL